MKRSQKTIMGLFISTLSLFLAATPVHAEPTITPSSLTVVETRCLVFKLGCNTVQRQLLLQTSEPLSNLQVVSLDLNGNDGASIIPATAIRAKVSVDSVQPNQPLLTIPVQFDFSQVQSGEYKGDLLVIYNTGQKLTVPVIVRVKDNGLLAWVVLLAGIALGMFMSAYRAEGMARDEVVVQVGRLRTQMLSDSELAESFQTKIAASLVDVETAFANKRWEAAQQAVAQAQTVWDKWRKGREDWVAQLKYLSSLKQRLDDGDMDLNAPYVQSVRSYLEDRKREIADQESPQKLSESLRDLQQQINRYLEGQARLEEFNRLITELPLDKERFWKLNSQRLQHGLDNLEPKEREAFNNWQLELKTQTDKLVEAIAQQSTTESHGASEVIASRGSIDIITANILAPVPSARNLPKPVQTANIRLRWFTWVSYIITLGLLAGAGFRELYVDKPTFGASIWNDYFALLAWGFGAEATRDAVTKVVRDWKLPGVKEK